MDPNEASIFTAAIILTSTVGIIIVYFVVSIIRQQQRNLQLNRKNILSEIASLEHERSRITNDLHDEVSPTLSVIKFQINSLQLVREEDRLQVNHASEHLDRVVEKMREISNNLVPNSLLRKGLCFSIEEFIRNFENVTRIPVQLESMDQQQMPPLSQEKNLNIYRLLQEVMHNGLKHADASEMKLKLDVKDNYLTLFYKDNGKGFDYQKALRESNGFGLRSMKSRVEILNGRLSVESKANVGTAFLFEIPLKN